MLRVIVTHMTCKPQSPLPTLNSLGNASKYHELEVWILQMLLESCWAITSKYVCVSQRFRGAIAENNSSDLLENVGQVRQPSTLAFWTLGEEHSRLPDQETQYNILVTWSCDRLARKAPSTCLQIQIHKSAMMTLHLCTTDIVSSSQLCYRCPP
jgi:hypothetical protein